MYQAEHDELFASIRSGKPINNGEYMCQSTLMAIMGRMASYTGQNITWDMAMNSQEDLTPPKYDWDIELPVPPVARTGDNEVFANVDVGQVFNLSLSIRLSLRKKFVAAHVLSQSERRLWTG